MEILQLPRPCLQSDSELLITLDTVEAARTQLETYYLELIADLESRGLATELGARDTTELLALRHRRDPGDIRSDLKLVKNLSKYDAITAALSDPSTATATPDPASATPGTVVVLTPALARVIVATLEKAPPTVPVDDLRVAEEQLIEAARHLTPSGLRDFGRKVLDTLDTDGPEPAEDNAARNESLQLRAVDHGVKFTGFLAGENAELFQTEIHRLAKPRRTVDGDLDPRPHDKRQADALTTILEAAAGATAAAAVPGIPQLTVTIDFADLQNATSEAVGELVFGDNLSACAVRRLACDAAVLPIVLGSDSQPLDVGTEYRFVTRAIRRALNRRDKGCVICQAPPSLCHAHHLIHWADGGSTSITNLVLLCRAHHRAVHAGHWAITITDGTVQITRPGWTTPTPATLTTLPLPGTEPRPPARLTTPQLPGTEPCPPARLTTPQLPGVEPCPSTPNTGTTLQPRPISVAPHHEQPNRLNPTSTQPSTSTQPTLTATATRTGGLSWLTPEATAELDPWGETGNPSAGP